MNLNRNVLRPTHNRLVLQEFSTDKPVLVNKTKFCTNSSLQQQENVNPINYHRPILTATRSIKKLLKNHADDQQMVVSPMVPTIHRANIVHLQKPNLLEANKTREQLEQELLELYVSLSFSRLEFDERASSIYLDRIIDNRSSNISKLSNISMRPVSRFLCSSPIDCNGVVLQRSISWNINRTSMLLCERSSSTGSSKLPMNIKWMMKHFSSAFNTWIGSCQRWTSLDQNCNFSVR